MMGIAIGGGGGGTVLWVRPVNMTTIYAGVVLFDMDIGDSDQHCSRTGTIYFLTIRKTHDIWMM